MDAPGTKFQIRSNAEGKIELTFETHAGSMTCDLSGGEVTEVVAALLKASLGAYLVTHDLGAPGFAWPMKGPQDIYAPMCWPLVVAMAQPAADEKRMAIGLAAAYGNPQVFVGLQRMQLKQLGEALLHMDRHLPPSNKFELELEWRTTSLPYSP